MLNRLTSEFGYFFLIIFIIAGIESLWRKKLKYRFFSKKWCSDEYKFTREYLLKIFIDLSNNTTYGFGIWKYTTICLKKIPVPIVYAQIDHPRLGTSSGRYSSKGLIALSNSKIIHELFESFPAIFKFCCEHNTYKVYLIKNLKKLEKSLLSNSFER